MKRSAESSSSSRGPSKRSRSLQACAACRKHKSRCELLEDLNSPDAVKCHRCRILDIACSFEEMDRRILQSSLTRKTQAWEHVLNFSGSTTKALSTSSSPTATGPGLTSDSSINDNAIASDMSDLTSATQAVPIEVTALPQEIWNYSELAPGVWRYSNEATPEHASSVSWNWSTPLGSLRELTNRYLTTHYGATINERRKSASTSPPPPPQKLTNILSQTKISDLLGIFTSHFLPWLNINLIHSKQSQPDPGADSILDLICCTIASRFSPDPFISSVLSQLQASSDEIISRIILNPHSADPLESIQCLLIFAVWAPIPYGLGSNPSSDGMRDGYLLLSAALSLAGDIQLDKAPEKLTALRKSHAGPTGGQHCVEDDQLREAEDLARLWVALLNTDSLLCAGTRRVPSSHGSRQSGILSDYYQIFPLSKQVVFPDVMKCRDARTHLLGRTLEGMNLGVSASMKMPEDIEGWYKQVTDSLECLRFTKRLAAPLPFVAEHDKFYFRMLEIILCCCRLLVLQQALYTTRLLFTQSGESAAATCAPAPSSDSNYTFPWSRRPNNLRMYSLWGRDARPLMEYILILLQDIDPALLGTSPDYVFHMITFNAVFLITYKLVVWNAKCMETGGADDVLTERLAGLLERASRVRRSGTVDGIEHPAKRSAMLIGGVLGLWKNKETLIQKRSRRKEDLNSRSGGEASEAETQTHSQSQSQRETVPLHGSSTSSSSTSGYESHAHGGQFSTDTTGLGYQSQTIPPHSQLYPSLSPQISQGPSHSQDASIYQSQTHHLYMDQNSAASANYGDAGDSWIESALFQDPQFWNEMWNYQASFPPSDFAG